MKALALLAAALMMLAALVLFAPAAWLDARLNAATGGQLRLTDTAGTVWNGRGRLANDHRTLSLPVAWRVDPWALLRGDLALTLQGAEGSGAPRGIVAWREPALALDGFSLALPASALDGTLAPADAMALGGTLTIGATHLRWNGSGGEGTVALQWTGARVAGGAATVALGTVSTTLIPRNGSLEGRIENRGGEVRVDGEFAWSPAAANVNATVGPLPSTPPAVVRALGALGTPDANGAVRLQWHSGSR